MGGYGLLTEEQISTIEAIVCVVESGRTDKYDAIATMKGDTGGLSFGRHQASLGSGNLYKLVKAYCDAPGAAWADELQPYLKKLADKNVALNTDTEIKKLLRSAGADPVMTDVQDKFFFDAFMLPALKRWESFGFETALSAATIYDSYIHGNFDLIAKRVAIEPKKDTERSWVKDYLEKRYIWLSTHSNTLLHATAIRIEALQALAEAGNWDLSLPFDLKRPSSHYPMTVYDLPARCFVQDGVPIVQRYRDPKKFPIVYSRKKSGAAPGNQRDIFIQRGLIAAGFMQPGTADGDFGTGTEVAIKKFQKQMKLKDNGGIGPDEYVKLCEAIEVGGLAPDPNRADAGLKPAPSVDDKRVTIGGTVVAAGGAAATAAGSVAMGGAAADSAAADAKADAKTNADGPSSTTAATKTPAPLEQPETAPTATTPAASADPAPAAPMQTDQAQPGATTPAAPAAPSQTTAGDTATKKELPAPPAPPSKGKLCARTETFTEVPFTNCKLSRSDTLTIGAAGLFIVAVGLFIFGRRIFDRSNT